MAADDTDAVVDGWVLGRGEGRGGGRLSAQSSRRWLYLKTLCRMARAARLCCVLGCRHGA